MRRVCFLCGAMLWLVLLSASFCTGQVEDGTEGHVFRHNALGLTFPVPDGFFPKVEKEIRALDPAGREHVVLALWKSPDRSGVPRMAFLYDTMVRSTGSSREQIANGWLNALRTSMQADEKVKMFATKTMSLAGRTVWRLDYLQLHGGQTLPYNSAIVIPLSDRRLLAIQVNAPSQGELDAELATLRALRFDH